MAPRPAAQWPLGGLAFSVYVRYTRKRMALFAVAHERAYPETAAGHILAAQ